MQELLEHPDGMSGGDFVRSDVNQARCLLTAVRRALDSCQCISAGIRSRQEEKAIRSNVQRYELDKLKL